MAGEYLSPQQAKEVKLSIFSWKRRRQVREYAGQLALGIPQYEESHIVEHITSRAALVILAESRETIDKVKIAVDEISKSVQELITGVPDPGTQPTLFEQLGE